MTICVEVLLYEVLCLFSFQNGKQAIYVRLLINTGFDNKADQFPIL